LGCDEFKDAFFFYHYPGPLIETEPVPVPKPVQNRTEPHSQANVTRVEQDHPAEELDPLAKQNPLPEQTQNKTKSDASQKVDLNHQVLLKQINRLEKNLTWMGSYLETLSNTYKRQMDDVRTRYTIKMRFNVRFGNFNKKGNR
jgi:hypothetical protein